MLHIVRRGLIGALAGGIATVPMTAFMLAAQRKGYLGEAPPKLITNVALISAGVHIHDQDKQTAVAGSVHFGFGIVCGALFGALSWAATAPARMVQGMLFGLTVWFVSYNGWIPALHIMPSPEDDRPRRPIVMILAHLIYGSILGGIVGRIESDR